MYGKALGEEGKGGAGEGYYITRGVNNRPVVVVEEDILAGVPQEKWAETVKENLKKRFPNGIAIANNQIMIDRQSRNELTWSKYSQKILNTSSDMYADKMRATNYADEILMASTGWTNEDSKHFEKNKLKDFGRGKVRFRIGNRDYEADVLVGAQTNDSLKLYDLLKIEQIKEADATLNEIPLKETARYDASASKETVPHSVVNVNAAETAR